MTDENKQPVAVYVDGEKREPDYVYDPNDWESTYGWEDRSILTDDRLLWEPYEFRTLVRGPSMWAVEVILAYDEEGDPDETEIRWFETREEAEAAVEAAQPRSTEP